MFSGENVGIIAIIGLKLQKYEKKLTVILVILHFTALQSSVFGKVRELVGEIKHTFDPTSNTPVPY